MQIKSYLTHKNIFFLGLVLLATGIPISRFLISVSQLLLLGNWIVEMRFAQKWNALKRSKTFWAYISLFLFYVIGMLWTSDLDYGLKDLRIKLPMIWLPVLLYTSPKLSKQQYHIVLHFFVLSVIVASCWSLIVYFGFTKIEIHDIREISRFESHIRFSLMIVIAVLYLFFVLLKKDTHYRLLYAIVILWLLCFLIVLQSFTGIVIGTLVGGVALWWILMSKRTWAVKAIFSLLILSAGGYVGNIIYSEWKKVYQVNKIDLAKLPLETKSRRLYYHDKESKLVENGNPVLIYIQTEELKKEWNKRSWRGYDSLDLKGNELRYTLFRYLASKGLTRDSVGISKLDTTDIRNVENGIPNYLYAKSTLRSRVHEFLWEIAQARIGQDPTGHSLVMRLEFWKTAWHIIREHKAFGVGTGDVEKAFKDQYAKDKTTLLPRWQLRAHNQFLATMVGLGFAGLILFLLFFLSPLLSGKKHSRFFVLFMLVQFLSFFNEDSLETQAGVTICVFFTQFLFHHDEYNL